MQVIVDRGRDPDDAKPACMERVRPGLRPVPPADDQASTRWCASASRSRRCPASSLNSGHRALRRMVPPSWMMPPTSRWRRPGPPGRTDGCRRPSTSCAHVVVRDAGFRASRPTWCPAAPAGAVPRMMYRRVNGGRVVRRIFGPWRVLAAGTRFRILPFVVGLMGPSIPRATMCSTLSRRRHKIKSEARAVRGGYCLRAEVT